MTGRFIYQPGIQAPVLAEYLPTLLFLIVATAGLAQRITAPTLRRVRAAFATDDNDDAGRLFGGNRLVDDGIEPIEAGKIEPGARFRRSR